MTARWRRSGRGVGLMVAMVVIVALLAGHRWAAAAAPAGGTSYVNPVSRSFADTFADPAVIRGKDGWWYSYGTSDPLREGEGRSHRIPIARSHDLVDWEHIGDAFSDATLPSWAEPTAGIWAPDIRYVDGEWRMYYVVTETKVSPVEGDNAIGMATAPSPAGPWTDSGAPVVGPRPAPGGGYLWTFDPAAVTDTDGSQWLFYGSYFGGIHVVRLDDEGRHAVGAPTMVAIDNKFEGAYVIRRDGWWYLFASTANCCAGPTTGYSVQVGRSRDLRGPYVDREGTPLTISRAGGTPTLIQNGNRWIGAGHNAVVTDLAGQDWIVYHAIDPADPYLDGTSGINERPMLLDRLDWIDGWPQVRAGRGPSDGRERGPVTDGQVASTSLTRVRDKGSVRVEADLKGRAPGLTVGEPGSRPQVSAVVDSDAGVLRVRALGRNGAARVATAPLPANFDPDVWHSVVLQVRDGRAYADLTHARLGDPLAVARLRLPKDAGEGARAGATAGSEVANLSVRTPTPPVTRAVREDVPGRLVSRESDEFNGSTPAPGWSWVRQDPNAQVTGGVLRWPTQAADLVGDGNNAGVLLRDAREGDWTIETKLSIDLGTDTVRNFQQAGLIAYVGDDLFTRFSHVAIWNTRQTEFGKEMPYAGRTSFGGTIVGPPADTTWLRLTHHEDRRDGEHELRAWSSRNGRDWVKGGVWTLPPDADLRVGLVSHGGEGATARFDYFRTYR